MGEPGAGPDTRKKERRGRGSACRAVKVGRQWLSPWLCPWPGSKGHQVLSWRASLHRQADSSPLSQGG